MKNILITGSTDGLGKALCKQLCQSDNYNVILCGRNTTKMEALYKELPKEKVLYFECFDMLDEESVHAFASHIKEKGISIDVLINNAGANYKKAKVEDLDLNDLKQMLQLNCISHLQCIQEFYPMMKVQGSGHIINVLSSCCLYTNETMAGYTASKNAMQAISKALTKEARLDHIKVTNVYPGGIDTDFRKVPNHTYLKPETVADAIIKCIELPDEAVLHDLVLRPFSESNF